MSTLSFSFREIESFAEKLFKFIEMHYEVDNDITETFIDQLLRCKTREDIDDFTMALFIVFIQCAERVKKSGLEGEIIQLDYIVQLKGLSKSFEDIIRNKVHLDFTFDMYLQILGVSNYLTKNLYPHNFIANKTKCTFTEEEIKPLAEQVRLFFKLHSTSDSSFVENFIAKFLECKNEADIAEWIYVLDGRLPGMAEPYIPKDLIERQAVAISYVNMIANITLQIQTLVTNKGLSMELLQKHTLELLCLF